MKLLIFILIVLLASCAVQKPRWPCECSGCSDMPKDTVRHQPVVTEDEITLRNMQHINH
jgi:hypothetical protein